MIYAIHLFAACIQLGHVHMNRNSDVKPLLDNKSSPRLIYPNRPNRASVRSQHLCTNPSKQKTVETLFLVFFSDKIDI